MIPTIQNMQDMLGIREKTLNAMVTKANTHFQDVVDAGLGWQCVVDTRIFPFSTTQIGPSSEHPDVDTNWAIFDVELDDDEYPVRAVVRTFDNAQNKGTYERSASTEYNRTTKKLFVDAGPRQSGEACVELWKQIRK